MANYSDKEIRDLELEVLERSEPLTFQSVGDKPRISECLPKLGTFAVYIPRKTRIGLIDISMGSSLS